MSNPGPFLWPQLMLFPLVGLFLPFLHPFLQGWLPFPLSCLAYRSLMPPGSLRPRTYPVLAAYVSLFTLTCVPFIPSGTTLYLKGAHTANESEREQVMTAG